MQKYFLASLLILCTTFTGCAPESKENTATEVTRGIHGRVVHVPSIQEFDRLIKENTKVVVDFWAPWCGPCRSMGPIIDQLAKEFFDILFIKVDIDTAQMLAKRYNIRSIPTFAFFKNGRKVYSFCGQRSKNDMRKEIRNRL